MSQASEMPEQKTSTKTWTTNGDSLFKYVYVILNSEAICQFNSPGEQTPTPTLSAK